MKSWPLPDALRAVGLKHPRYRPGWVFRGGEVAHVNGTAKWLLEHGDALFAAAPVRSVLIGSVAHDQLAPLARCSWLSRIEHLGLALKQGAPLAELLASPHLEAVRSLDLSWSSNDPAYLPHDLTRKTLGPLLASPLLAQLSSLRTSVASIKLLLDVVAACGHLKHLGLRMQGGFAHADAARIGAAMDLPVLRSLTICNAVTPAHAPALRWLRVRGGGVLDGDLLGRLERLTLDHVFAPDLARTLSQEAPSLRTLRVGCGGTDQADESWASVTSARLPALEKLSLDAPATPDRLRRAADAGVLARLRDLTLNLDAPDALAAFGRDLSGLQALRVWWPGDESPVLPELAALEKLSLGSCFGASGDSAISAVLERPPPRLEHLAMARERNHPGATEAGLRALMDSAPDALRYLYLRLGKLPRKLSAQLHQRFTIYDGGMKLTSPFGGLADWTWPYLPWGPPLGTIDED